MRILLVASAVLFLSLHASAFYVERSLVSDLLGEADKNDTNLVNPIGIASLPNGGLWVANNKKGVSSVYDWQGFTIRTANGTGLNGSLVIDLPHPDLASNTGQTVSGPTGMVANLGGFNVSGDNGKESARFIWVTEEGTVVAWAPSLGSQGSIVADLSQASNSVRSGARLAGVTIGLLRNGTKRLFVTNIKDGLIEVFDESFRHLADLAFTDSTIPKSYGPFGIRTIHNYLYVTFVHRNETDRTGSGRGYVSVFDTTGNVVQSQLIKRGYLNNPWGLELARCAFAEFSDTLLVGNHGDGLIHAYNLDTGAFLGTLRDCNGTPVVIKSLWGLHFGRGGIGGNSNELFYTAGLNNETNGLFGVIHAAKFETVSDYNSGYSIGLEQPVEDSETIDELYPPVPVVPGNNGNNGNNGGNNNGNNTGTNNGTGNAGGNSNGNAGGQGSGECNGLASSESSSSSQSSANANGNGGNATAGSNSGSSSGATISGNCGGLNVSAGSNAGSNSGASSGSGGGQAQAGSGSNSGSSATAGGNGASAGASSGSSSNAGSSGGSGGDGTASANSESSSESSAHTVTVGGNSQSSAHSSSSSSSNASAGSGGGNASANSGSGSSSSAAAGGGGANAGANSGGNSGASAGAGH